MKITLNIKLGIIAGLINCIIWYVAAGSLNYYSFDVDRYSYYATLILLLIGIFTSVFFARRTNDNFIDFKSAVKCGIIYTLVVALILGIFNYFYYSVIAPDAIDFFLSEAKKTMIEQKLSETDITKNLEIVRSYFGSFRMFMSTVIMGVLLSLLAGAMFRRKNTDPTFSAN